MATIINVDDVLTHDQLDDYFGGQLDGGQHLVPSDDADTAKARGWALDEVLAHLAALTPPVYEASLSTPAELKRAMTHKAAERIYYLAMTGGENAEVFHAKMRIEQGNARAALGQLRPTVAGGSAQASPMSIGISRR